jgi:hypothetical protein
MGIADGEDYPTVYKDAVIKIYFGEELKTTLTTDIYGEAETHLADIGEHRITIEHPHRQTMDFTVTSTQTDHHIFFNLANEPYMQAQTTATEIMTEAPYIEVNDVDGHEDMVLVPDVDNETLIALAFSLAEPEVTTQADLWLLYVTKLSDDANLTQGAVDPDEGKNQIATNDKTVTGTTKQYNLFNYFKIDGVTVLTNSATYGLINTEHKTEFEDIPFGLIRQLFAYFRAAWELTVSNTTENGTYEVLSGSSSKTYTSNTGGHIVCHSHYSGTPPVWVSDHMSFTQWDIDGVHYTTGATCSCPAKTKGTSHTLSCYESCEGLT